MPEDGAPIDWLTGDYEVLEYNCSKPRTAVIKVDAGLALDGALSSTSLTVHTSSGSLQIGGSVQGGSHLTVVGPNLGRINIVPGFADVHVEAAGSSVSLQLAAGTARLDLTDASWSIQSDISGGSAEPLCLRVSGTANVQGNRSVRELHATGPEDACTLGLVAKQGARLEAEGSLVLNRVAEGSKIVARHIEVKGDAGGTPEARTILESATDVIIEKSVAHCTIAAQGRVEVAHNVQDSTVTCDRLRVGRILNNSIVTATDGGGNHPAVQVGNAPIPPDPVYNDADVPGHVVWKPNFPDPRVFMGAIKRSEVRTRDDSIVSSGHIESSTVRTGRIICKSLATKDGDIRVREVYALDLTIDGGHVAVNSVMCAKLTASGQVAFEEARCQNVHGPEGDPKLVLSSRSLHCHGVTGDVELIVQEDLHLKMPDNQKVDVTSSGRALLEGGVVRELEISSPPGLEPLGDGVRPRAKVSVRSRIEHAIIRDCSDFDVVAKTTIEMIDVLADLRLDLPVEQQPKLSMVNEGPLEIAIADSTREPSLNAVLMLHPGASVMLAKQGEEERYLSIRLAREIGGSQMKVEPLELALAGRGSASLDTPAAELPDSAPALVLEGAVKVEVTGTIRRLDADASGGQIPCLTPMNDGTIVHAAAGRLSLPSPMKGVVFGRSRRREAEWLVIADLRAGNGKAPRSGKLIDVDVTELPLAQLETLSDIEVVDPTPQSLRKFAKSKAAGGTRSTRRADLRTRAEKATRIQAALAGRAIPGSSRAATQWAVSHLHHRALPGSLESLLRWVFRAFGYGQHPGVALLTWISVVLAVAVLRAVISLSSMAEFLQALKWSLLTSLVVPRFTIDSLEPLSANPLVQVGVTVLLTVPFLYFILSLKNFLASPGADGGSG